MDPSLRAKPLKVIIIAGIIAGTLDIIAACVHYYIVSDDKNPDVVLKFIASGVFGPRQAFSGGFIMSVLGLVLHYAIATLFAAIFVFIYMRWRWLSQNVILGGLLYGLLVWLVMNRIVLPLSNTNPQPFDWSKAVVAMLILMFFIGLPIALVTKRYSPRLSQWKTY